MSMVNNNIMITFLGDWALPEQIVVITTIFALVLIFLLWICFLVRVHCCLECCKEEAPVARDQPICSDFE